MSAAIKPVSINGAEATGSSMQLETENSKLKTSLPNSRRIYIDGEQPGVRVPFREIDQNPTRNFKNELEENPPVRVYDTSGPYGDPSLRTDVREGLTQLRRDWIIDRGDVEEYEGRLLQPIDDGYLTFEAAQTARERGRLEDFPRCAARLFAQSEAHASRRCTTPSAASSRLRWNSSRSEKTWDGPGYAGLRPALPMKAPRRRAYPETHSIINTPANLSALQSPHTSPPNSSATKSPAAAPSFPQTSITLNPNR